MGEIHWHDRVSKFISDLQKFVRPLQYPHRPITSLRNGKSLIHKNLFRNAFANDVDIDWELSMYDENNFLEPHTDRMTKYVSLLLYFLTLNGKINMEVELSCIHQKIKNIIKIGVIITYH